MRQTKSQSSEAPVKKLSFFDILTNINGQSKGNMFEGEKANEEELKPDSMSKVYVPFMINRGLGYFVDTVFYANEMNRAAHLPPKMQYDFLKGTIAPRKRFSKWSKKADDSAYVDAIKKKYNYSSDRAREVLHLFSEEQLKEMVKKQDTGGR